MEQKIVFDDCCGIDMSRVDIPEPPLRKTGNRVSIHLYGQAHYFMTAGEIKAAGGSAGNTGRIWTRKESLYKSVGEGISDFQELPEVLADRVRFFGMCFSEKGYDEIMHFVNM